MSLLSVIFRCKAAGPTRTIFRHLEQISLCPFLPCCSTDSLLLSFSPHTPGPLSGALSVAHFGAFSRSFRRSLRRAIMPWRHNPAVETRWGSYVQTSPCCRANGMPQSATRAATRP